MVLLVVVFPQMVMVYKAGRVVVDPSTVEIRIEAPMGTAGASPFGSPGASPFGSPGAPAFGAPAPSFGAPATPPPPSGLPAPTFAP